MTRKKQHRRDPRKTRASEAKARRAARNAFLNCVETFLTSRGNALPEQWITAEFMPAVQRIVWSIDDTPMASAHGNATPGEPAPRREGAG